MKKSIICLYVMAFCLFGLDAPVKAEGAEIVPLDQKIQGYSYSDYTQDWWRWATLEYKLNNPLDDFTGEQCGNNQEGDVWYLANVLGSYEVQRVCKIPAGKYILIPVINALSVGKNEDCNDLQKDAALYHERVKEVKVVIDGKEIKNIPQYRVKSDGCFDLEGYLNNTESYTHYTRAASDGYWIILKPLSVGSHKIRFFSFLERHESKQGRLGDVERSIEYDIEVVEDEFGEYE